MGIVIHLKNVNDIGGRCMNRNSVIGYDRNSIEVLAHEVLESYDIRNTPVDPLLIAKELGIKVYAESFSTYNGDKVSGAITKDEKGKIEILVNESDTYERQRFTVAHELGHYFMHIKDAHKYERVDMHRATGYNTNMPQEVEANNFAAALLMDKDMIYENISIAKNFNLSRVKCIEYLANLFEVSKPAMEYRLKNLGLL